METTDSTERHQHVGFAGLQHQAESPLVAFLLRASRALNSSMGGTVP